MKLEPISAVADELKSDMVRAAKKPGIQGMLTYVEPLDELLRGIKPGTYGLISGRTGMGKTAFALHMAREQSQRGYRVGFVSLEMPRKQLAYRLMAAATGTSQRTFQEGYAAAPTVEAGLSALKKMNLYVNSTTSTAVPAVQKLIADSAAECDVIYVDYMQLLRSGASTRLQELALASKSMMEAALRFDIPIVGLAQLNRDAAQLTPALHNLKGAGDFEEDSAFVIALHKSVVDKKGDVFDDPAADEADDRAIELHVLKNRFGDVGSVEAVFDKQLMRFT